MDSSSVAAPRPEMFPLSCHDKRMDWGNKKQSGFVMRTNRLMSVIPLRSTRAAEARARAEPASQRRHMRLPGRLSERLAAVAAGRADAVPAAEENANADGGTLQTAAQSPAPGTATAAWLRRVRRRRVRSALSETAAWIITLLISGAIAGAAFYLSIGS